MLAPISWRVPPRHYGPWEQFVSLLTEGLVDRGVDVTLFATADSISRARLVGVAPAGYSEDPRLDPKVWEALHISAAFERAAEFDLIHNSFDFLPLTYSGLVDTPVVTTIHGFSDERIVRVYEKYDRTSHYVAISEADRNENLDYIATIHHGIDMSRFVLGRGEGGYLLYFGRIHPDKGTAAAIDVAGTNRIAADHCRDRPGSGVLRPVRCATARLRAASTTSVPVEAGDRSDLLGNATALLHLIDFDEPFGFSVIEAMACGTPVIAADRGSMREIVVEGTNGFRVGSLDEAAESGERGDGTGTHRGARVG